MTDKQKEERLNTLYSDCYTEDKAVETLIYLAIKGRQGGSTTENHIRKAYRERKLGSLLRRLDPIAFNCERF